MVSDLSVPTTTLEANHAVLKNLLAAFGPESLRDVRDLALANFSKKGVPTHKDEEFKYLNLRDLSEVQYVPSYGATVSRASLESTPLGQLDAITVTLVNGQYAPELSTTDSLPAGVFVGTLADAFEAIPEVVEKVLGKLATYEGKLGSTNDDRFIQLNTAYLGEGVFLYVPTNVVLERPVHFQYVTQADHGALATFPRTAIVLGENAQAKVVESYVGLTGQAFTNAVTEAYAAKNSILELTRFQSESAETIHISNTSVFQEEGSTVTHTSANLGGQIVRNDVDIWSGGEHTETSLNAANVGTGEQVIDNHTRIDHATPNCHSFETYKSILSDRATGVFNGKIFVYLDAQKTDAKQTNQAILLSPQATMNTKPQLEIFADDVKCTHGATIGQLREDALFYLRARGIPKPKAEALLVYAFAAEVLEKISVDEVREALEKELFRKLESTDSRLGSND